MSSLDAGLSQFRHFLFQPCALCERFLHLFTGQMSPVGGIADGYYSTTSVSGAAGAEAAAPAVEKTEFDVELVSFGDKKIQVIKVVRELTGLGLKEAKDLVESAPGKVLEGIAKDAAEKAQEKLQEQGATVAIK